jgi:hypothetical protein
MHPSHEWRVPVDNLESLRQIDDGDEVWESRQEDCPGLFSHGIRRSQHWTNSRDSWTRWPSQCNGERENCSHLIRPFAEG